MKLGLSDLKHGPAILGIAIGVVSGIAFYLFYVYIFQEGGSVFYPFALLILFCCPIIGGITCFVRTKKNRRLRASLVSGTAVFAILVILSFLSYVILPVFFYNSVEIPASCMNETSRLPSNLNYTIPNVGTGTLLTSDARSAVVVMIDWNNQPLNSTLFLLNESNNQIIASMKFSNDILAATISNGILYMFNDNIVYMINTRNGESVRNLFETDNFRQLYVSNNSTYVQTDVEISALNVNGSVLSHLKLSLRSIAFGCFIP